MLEVNSKAATAPAIPPAGLSIAEAARRTGVSVHTLRYYERAGLVVTPVDRTQSGRRRYHAEDLKWIGICTKLRSTGMPIKAIRRYAQLVSAGPGNDRSAPEFIARRCAPSGRTGRTYRKPSGSNAST